MKNYLVSYDLNAEGQDYESLINAIKSYSNVVSVLKSVWFIQSNLSATTIREALLQHMDNNDYLIVLEITRGNGALYLDESKVRALSHYGYNYR